MEGWVVFFSRASSRDDMFAKEEKERSKGKKIIFYIFECFKSQRKDITKALSYVILISKIMHASYDIYCI